MIHKGKMTRTVKSSEKEIFLWFKTKNKTKQTNKIYIYKKYTVNI